MRRFPATLLASALFAALAAALSARADEGEEQFVLGAGTRVGDGSRVTTYIHPQSTAAAPDADEYVLDGYAGQTLRVEVRSQGALIPKVSLRRPDGTSVGMAQGARLRPLPGPRLPAPKVVRLDFPFDRTGVWTLRVEGDFPSKRVHDNPSTPANEGDDPATEAIEWSHVAYDLTRLPQTFTTTGPYSLAVHLAGAPRVFEPSLLRNAQEEIRLLVPGAGGGKLSTSLRWKSSPAPTFVSFRGPDGAEIPGFAAALRTTFHESSAREFVFPASHPVGDCVLTYRQQPGTYEATYRFRASLKAPPGPKPLRGKLNESEPRVLAVEPAIGGPGTAVTVSCENLFDPERPDGTPRVLFGRFAGELVEVGPGSVIVSRAPANLPEGTFDIVVESTSGQAAARARAWRRLPPPHPKSLSRQFGSWMGGFEVEVSGQDLNPAPGGVRIEFVDAFDGSTRTLPVAFDPLRQTDLRLVFRMPEGSLALPRGVWRVRVVDLRSELSALVPGTLEVVDQPVIERVSPGLVAALGGEDVSIFGLQFDVAAEVLLEDAFGAGTYTPVVTTFHGQEHLSFNAPARPKGTWHVKVRSLGKLSSEASYASFEFADLTPGLPAGDDPWDATSSALGDFDGDGDEDLFLSRALTGVDERQASPQTRVLRNEGGGVLTDVTTSVMPAVLADDDWRADRVACADVDGDGYADVVITTNSRTVPAAARSHTRILLSEPRAAHPSDRVLRDRTSDLMPPPRTMQTLGYGYGVPMPDNWRAKDLWVGDLDRDGPGPPEIVVTHDEVKEDLEVGCAPYCASPYAGAYTYSFYWGGSRKFVWDRHLRGGLGRYKFDHQFFPRKSGVTVPIFNPPAGVAIPLCNSDTPCRGKFTPFAGDRVAVGDLDGDDRPDVAVLAASSTLPGNVPLATPLQVLLSPSAPARPVPLDVTKSIPASSTADAVAIGRTAAPSGEASGLIAVARASPPVSGPALRLWRFRPGALPTDPGTFEEITATALPDPLPPDDAFQASVLRFVDIDRDGAEDLVLLAAAAPGGTSPALRILRSGTGSFDGALRPAWAELIGAVGDATADLFDGTALSIGDLDGDGALEFVMSRAAGSAPGTRGLRIDAGAR